MGNVLSTLNPIPVQHREPIEPAKDDGCDVTTCFQVQRLMKQLNSNDNMSETKIIDDFCHLLTLHNDDHNFQYIYNVFGANCDITKCNMFHRNFSDKNKKQVSVRQQIKDKIHCYYQHTFDIGHRLNSKQRAIINDNEQKIDEDATQLQLAINNRLIKLKEIINAKQKHQNNQSSNTQKYNHISKLLFDEKHSMYNFGLSFTYGYKGELTEDDGIKVKAKYISLKEELINNKISILTVPQFNNEYKKAKIHFNSVHCKKTFKPYKKTYTNIDVGFSKRYNVQFRFLMNNILSLMVYCNYTILQCKLSKTYRENNGLQHTEFYHLGKYLKISVQKFGTETKDGSIESFYHGIGQQLMFPSFMGQVGIGISIKCPLSTSSSLPVAINFTDHNNGLIIEFGFYEKAMSKYFAVSWLSDYPGESEYLFVQNYGYLTVKNIIDVQYGTEYKIILNALQCIDDILCEPQPLYRPINIEKYPTLKNMILAILEHQLSRSSLTRYNSQIHSLSEYGQQMIDIYFGNYDTIFLNYNDFVLESDGTTKIYINEDTTYTYPHQYDQTKYCPHAYVLNIFFHDNYEWIDMNNINVLFPNLTTIYVSNLNISTKSTMNDLLRFLGDTDIKSSLKEIVITAHNMALEKLVDEYALEFRKIGIFISADLSDSELFINRCNEYNFVQTLIDEMDHRYFCNSDNNIVKLMDGLIKNELSNVSIDSDNDSSQYLFHQYCVNNTQIYIDWNKLVSHKCNEPTYLFQLFCIHNQQYQWINLTLLIQLFPKMERLIVHNINLCSFLLDDVLNHLKENNGSNMQVIEIREIDVENSILHPKKAILQYKKQFEKIKFNMIQKKRNVTETELCVYQNISCQILGGTLLNVIYTSEKLNGNVY
eukprot:417386_1